MKTPEVGMKLPAERQLAMQLGVSRNSLREALAKLVSEGVPQSTWRRDVYWRRNVYSLASDIRGRAKTSSSRWKTLMADDPDYMLSIFWKPATPLKPAPHGMQQCARTLAKRKIQLC